MKSVGEGSRPMSSARIKELLLEERAQRFVGTKRPRHEESTFKTLRASLTTERRP